jgi:cobalt-zinc-cadmium efflux system protein
MCLPAVPEAGSNTSYYNRGKDPGIGRELSVSSTARLLVAAVAISGLAALKAILAITGSSLALWSDAGHSLADLITMAAAYVAARAAQRPATTSMTWGYPRAGVLVGFASGLGLWALVIWIGGDAVHALLYPTRPDVTVMLFGGGVSLIVNGVMAVLLSHPGRDLNLRSAWLHVLGDAGGSLAVLLAALAIAWQGWGWADPVGALIIAGVVAWAAAGIVRDAWRILMEASPADVNPEAVVEAMEGCPGVESVHHLHVWSVVPGESALSAHLLVDPAASLQDGQAIAETVHRMLHRRFHIAHTTLQVETGLCDEPRHGGHAVESEDGPRMLE